MDRATDFPLVSRLLCELKMSQSYIMCREKDILIAWGDACRGHAIKQAHHTE